MSRRHHIPPHALSAGQQNDTWVEGLATAPGSDSDSDRYDSVEAKSDRSHSVGDDGSGSEDEGVGWVEGLTSLREGEGATALLDCHKQTSTQEVRATYLIPILWYFVTL